MLFGCSSEISKVDPPTEPTIKDEAIGIKGYIVDQEDGSILVVSSEAKDYSGSGGNNEFYNAIWFTNAPKDVEIGQKVQVRYNFVKESYPGQSKAEHVSVLSVPKPDQAYLTEAQAIRTALQDREVDQPSVPVVKAVSYNEQTDYWSIIIKQGDSDLHIQVKDEFTQATAEAEVLNHIPSCVNNLQSFNDITEAEQTGEGFIFTVRQNCEPIDGEGPQMKTVYEYSVSPEEIKQIK